jgi:hypothetical protein
MRYLAIFLLSLWVYAQEDPLKLAILVRVHSGVGIGFWGKLANDLKQADALGKDFALRPWATTAGGNLDILIGRRLLLSGGAQLMHFDASETERGLARPTPFIMAANSASPQSIKTPGFSTPMLVTTLAAPKCVIRTTLPNRFISV